jgi:oxygen-independent coproporphyrinogen-3 oxidase
MPETATKTEVGSYFISNYPPYSQWTAEALPAVEAALAAPPADVPLGLYVHIPFCRKRCKFCYFRVYTDKNAGEVETYVAALSREIERISELPVMGGRAFRFVYFGGGTPSFLGVKQLHSLADRFRKSVRWDDAEEVTFECEPGTLAQPKVQALKEFGVTRLSLGIENFSDAILEENGRAHLSGEVYKSWDWITAAGFQNVNIDLIAGMVGETWDNWRDCVRRTIELAPDSVTIYQMELPFNTVYSQDILGQHVESPVADWPTKRAWVDYAFSELEAAGYSVSSAYTMVRDPRKVNFSYRDNLWRGSDLLCSGVASFGHVSGVHYQNKDQWGDYVNQGSGVGGRGSESPSSPRSAWGRTAGEAPPRAIAASLPLARGYVPTQHQRLVREMILQLKTGRLDVAYFRRKFHADILEQWRDVWNEYESGGYATLSPDRITLTRQGLLRADALLPAFFEPEFQHVRYT